MATVAFVFVAAFVAFVFVAAFVAAAVRQQKNKRNKNTKKAISLSKKKQLVLASSVK